MLYPQVKWRRSGGHGSSLDVCALRLLPHVPVESLFAFVDVCYSGC